jgi:hypothetical protein
MLKLRKVLIAPCGMNCSICSGHLREKKKCPGCRLQDPDHSDYCRKCIIKNCDFFKTSNKKYCSFCEKYPCKRLKALDKRYRKKYGMSMLENLDMIKEKGIMKFMEHENKRWECSECGGVINVHRFVCSHCGKERSN